MNGKSLGVITSSEIKLVDGRLGWYVEFKGQGFGVGWNLSFWDPETVIPNEHTKWTEGDRQTKMINTWHQLSKTLRIAKTNNVGDLRGVPVEIDIENNIIQKWRVLEEVLL